MEDLDTQGAGHSAPPDSDSRSLVELAEQLDRSRDLGEAAGAVAAYAVAHLGADVAGLALREPQHPPVRLAATDPVLAELDAVEGRLQQGPGTAHPEDGSVVTVADTRTDPLWPAWGAAAAQQNLISVRIVGMPPMRGRWVALEMFSRQPHAFTTEAIAGAVTAARHAGLALRHVDRIANLEEALRTRALIGQAQGILMERYDLTGDQAMSFLRRSSQNSQVKVRDLAWRLVSSRERGDQEPDLPGLPPLDDPPPEAPH